MNTLKNKWASYKAYKQTQKLYQDYVEVKNSKNISEIKEKLGIFLISVKNSYNEWIDTNPIDNEKECSFDSIFGECTNILLDLLDFIINGTNVLEYENIINDSLQVVDILLKDKKYRQIITDSSDLLDSILSLIDKIKNTAGKKILLEIICTLCDNVNTAVEIGHLRGFKKIENLLKLNDPLLEHEVILTYKHILGNIAYTDSIYPYENESTNGVKSIGSKLKNEFGKVITILTDNKSRNHNETMKKRTDVLHQKEIDVMLKRYNNNDPRQKKKDKSSPSSSDSNLSKTFRIFLKDNKQNESLSDTLKNLMREQNVLKSFVSLLENFNEEINEDVENIIYVLSQLIYKNSPNNIEFKKLEGFEFIKKYFNNCNLKDNKKCCKFLENFFTILLSLVFDGNSNMEITNKDVMKLLFDFATSSSYLCLRHNALYCIENIIILNPQNAVIIYKIGFKQMMNVLSKSLTLTKDQLGFEDMKKILNIKPFPNSHSRKRSTSSVGKSKSTSKYNKKFSIILNQKLLKPPSEYLSSDIYQYIWRMVQLIDYLIIMLTNYDKELIVEYIEILKNVKMGVPNYTINIILCSISRVLIDFNSRKIKGMPKVLKHYLKLLKDTLIPLEIDFFDISEYNILSERYKLFLQIIGLIIEVNERNIKLFSQNNGFEILYSILLNPPKLVDSDELGIQSQNESRIQFICDIENNLKIELTDFSLWLIREYLIYNEDGLKNMNLIVKLLEYIYEEMKKDISIPINKKNESHSYFRKIQDKCNEVYKTKLYIKILQVTSSIFRKNDIFNESRKLFSEKGGTTILLNILTVSYDEIASTAVITVGDMIKNSLYIKEYIANEYGYDRFINNLLNSDIPLDRTCYGIILELCTTGGIIDVLNELLNSRITNDSNLAPNQITSQYDDTGLFNQNCERFIISYSVNSLIEEIMYPTLLFPDFIPMTYQTSDTESYINSVGDIEDYQIDNSPRISNIIDSVTDDIKHLKVGNSSLENQKNNIYKKGSLQLDYSLKPMPSPSLILNNTSQNTIEDYQNINTDPKPVHVKKIQKLNQLYRRRSSIKNYAGVNFGNESMLNYYNKKIIKKVVNITFRDVITSKISLKLLAILSDNDDFETQHDYFNVLLLLLDINPKNKELMCQNNAIKFIIELILSSSQVLNICNIYLHKSMMKENQRRKGVEMGVVTRLTDDEINESYTQSLMDMEYRSGSPAYIELVNVLGTYSITPDIVKLLFQVAYNPIEIIQSMEKDFKALQKDENKSQEYEEIDILSLNEAYNETVNIDNLDNNFNQVNKIENVNNLFEENGGNIRNDFFDQDGIIIDVSQNFDSNISNSVMNEDEINDDLSKIQLNMLYTIEKLSEKANPFCFFNFDGIDGYFRINTFNDSIILNQGYTFSCWINIRAFIDNEIGLIYFENQQKLGIPLEVFFKSFSNSGHYCLCMRIQHWPLPPEDFVFDGFDFSEIGVWHYIMFTYDGKTSVLYVDGDLIQTYETSNFQKFTNSDKDFDVIIGKKSDIQNNGNNSSKGYFCGLIGTVHFAEGIWNEATCEMIYNKGPAYSYKDLKLPTRELITIYPHLYLKETKYGFSLDTYNKLLNSITLKNKEKKNNTSNNGEISDSIKVITNTINNQNNQINSINDDNKNNEEKDIENQSEKTENNENEEKENTTTIKCIYEKMEKEINDLEPKIYGSCEGGCTSHIVISIKDIIDKVGDIQLCLPFLEYKGEYQLTSLKIISSLLYKCPENVERFRKANGFHVLGYLLQKNIENISAEIFDVLFDIMSDDIIKNNQLVITIIDCLNVINDLLIISPNHIQIAVLRLITFILVDVPENMKTWREHIGIDVIFEFASFLQSRSHPFILRILDVMMKDFTIKELEKSCLYISSQREQNIEFKCDILELLYRHISNSKQSVEQLREIGGISLLIPLLDCQNERFRILILKMIGILMKTNIEHSEELLDKIVGYDVIKYYLLPYPITPELAEVLISMALNQYSMELTSSILEDISSSKKNKHKRNKSDESLNIEQGVDIDVLIYPRMIYLIIELLENVENGDLVIQVLNDIEKLLSKDNMEKLWEYPWIEWTYIFLQNMQNYNDNSMYHIINVIDSIIQKMMIYDLSRSNSVTESKKGALSEDDDMQSRIIVNVLIYFDNNPFLQQEKSQYIINNMIHLYKYMKESLSFSIQLNYHFANVINHLACHNNSTIRTLMKTLHFFEIRDDLIIDILKSEVFLEDVQYFLEKFSFEILANQSKFRENDGLLFVLRLFHHSHEYYNVQSMIGNILINNIMPIPINSEIIQTIIQDDVVFEKLKSLSSKSENYYEYNHDNEDFAIFPSNNNNNNNNNNKLNNQSYSNNNDVSINNYYQKDDNEIDNFLSWYYSSDLNIISRRVAIEQRIENSYKIINKIFQAKQKEIETKRQEHLQKFIEYRNKYNNKLNLIIEELELHYKSQLENNEKLYQNNLNKIKAERFKRNDIGYKTLKCIM
ncbi:hypothetical protein BCR36DRAFT_585219 [Piromyces finnis]|uniref:DUF4704 domain-containing protein n=1 Tax=Piromyces finnis TaxID=1754191 RepID=A0A1Y1V4C4_9FUNG|nr:hypothetical protein BCR36DRAFT_585219 [Piromyces finnis]|eukprot:ORX46401.1 hypothetical protein BCR36DRAFT_585219 [Piromyces finnis]